MFTNLSRIVSLRNENSGIFGPFLPLTAVDRHKSERLLDSVHLYPRKRSAIIRGRLTCHGFFPYRGFIPRSIRGP